MSNVCGAEWNRILYRVSCAPVVNAELPEPALVSFDEADQLLDKREVRLPDEGAVPENPHPPPD